MKTKALVVRSKLPRKRGKFPGGFCKTGNPKHHAYTTQIDGRTKDARELQIVKANWINDLGGIDNLSSMQLTIINNLTVIAWRCKRLGRAIVSSDGEVAESVTRDFLRFHNSLVDGLCKLGLQRQAKNIDAELDALRKKYTYAIPAQASGETK